ncbi:MAG: type II secretion system protein GspG [Bacteroidota bacterium]
MADLIAELLILFESLKFWKRKKKRREIEKGKNLPKKTMIHPTVWILLILLGLVFSFRFLYGVFFNQGESLTKNKIVEIGKILEDERSGMGKYPLTLDEIIRNNPLRKNLKIDAWGNDFHYRLLDNGLKYELISAGKDGIMNSKDDIKNN